MIDKKSSLVLRIKSVPNPTAQYAIPCSVLEEPTGLVLKAVTLSGSASPWPIPLRLIIHLQLLFGLRISEVLNITNYDLLSLGRIKIRTQKRGQDRIINYSDTYKYLDFCRKTSSHPFRDYNRFFVYREYKKHGIGLFHSKTGRYSITHSFRHIAAQTLNKEVKDKKLISNYIGHKSLKSLESYL